MNTQNPFESGSATSSNSGQSQLFNPVVGGVLIGAIAGLVLGILGIGGMFYFLPGAPGLIEILILLAGIVVVVVPPCAGMGALIGVAVKSSRKNRE